MMLRPWQLPAPLAIMCPPGRRGGADRRTVAMALLEINDLRKHYPTGEKALRGVDIEELTAV